MTLHAHNALRIRSEAGGKRSLLEAESAESAGCEALRAEQPADEIRSALSPGAKRPARIRNYWHTAM